MKLESDVLNVLNERGFIKDCTDIKGLDFLCKNEKITLYTGYDLSADSLHIGNLMTLMMARIFQKLGHKVITLLGGATTKIGDPTGKDEMRKLLSDEQISNNLKGIEKNLHQVLGRNFKVVNNYDWLSKKGYLEILQEVGTIFSVNRMIKMDSVENRLQREQLMTFLEFNYMIFQGYDFYHLAKNENCVLQIGGSDQWGNLIQGLEINSRLLNRKTFALTCPLITKSDGTKMGKSVNGAVWLSREKFLHFDYFQYFRNIDDADIPKCLRFFTDLPINEIEKLENLKGKEINEAKKVLAFEATKIIHGEDFANEALKSAVEIHEKSSENAVMQEKKITNTNILEVLIEVGFASSKGDAKKLITQNAVKINGENCTDINFHLQENDNILQVGKKKFLRIIL